MEVKARINVTPRFAKKLAGLNGSRAKTLPAVLAGLEFGEMPQRAAFGRSPRARSKARLERGVDMGALNNGISQLIKAAAPETVRQTVVAPVKGEIARKSVSRL